MTKINPNTKKARSYRSRWLASTPMTLSQAYRTCSLAKRQAWAYCERLQAEMDGSGLRVVGRTVMAFSVAFECPEGIVWITKDHDYLIPPEDAL